MNLDQELFLAINGAAAPLFPALWWTISELGKGELAADGFEVPVR